MKSWKSWKWCLLSMATLVFAAGGTLFLAGCGSGGGGENTIVDVNPGGGDTGALKYGGTVSGTVSTSISSSGSTAAPVPKRSNAKTVEPAPAGATIYFKDLDGNPLKDANGNEYPPVQVNADSTFEAEGLPVGVDFVIEVDLDGDGNADLSHVVSIPKNEDGETGSVEQVDVNPLTTMAVAKLKSIITQKGVTAETLDFSPAAVIGQMISAFETLFDAMGIDSTITADQIMSKTIEALADAFDELVPDSVKTTMDMATSKIDLGEAKTPEDLVLAVIPALLHAGIAVADEPGGTLLDSVADLPNVEIVTPEQMWGPGPDQPDAPAPVTPGEENRIFRSTVIEVDRNFAAMNNEGNKQARQMGLVIRKHALERMAGLAFEGKTLSLRDLSTLATDLAKGMGMRLSYGVPMPPPNPGEPFDPTWRPPMVFQSADQHGVEIDMQAFEEQIFSIMRQGPISDAQRESQEAAIRSILQSALGGTQAPSLEQLFGGIMSDEPVTWEGLSVRIRNARSHMPFNWSGDSTLYVLADSDRFRNQDAKAVTVDVVLDQNGQLAKVTRNAGGTGTHYLRCFGDPQSGYRAELIVAATGRMVFDQTGRPVQADMTDETVLEPFVDSTTGQTVTFLDAFSKTGEFWPIEPALTVANPWYDPEKDSDPATNPPTIQIHVMVTQPGPDGQVVKVSVANETVVRDEQGSYALDMFWEGPPVNGMMAVLTDVRTGRRLHRNSNNPASEEFRVLPSEITGLEVTPQTFTHIFDIGVPNPMYKPEGDPWYDDINENGLCDTGEPTFSWKEELGNADDWRSTNVERYYRRSDTNGPVRQRDVDFSSPMPKTFTGVDLVPRDFKRRNNAFTFGRPNSALNLLSAFLSQNFFDGTHKLNGDTRVSAFGALAMMNLIFDARLYNLEAYVVNYGPQGPQPAQLQIVEAHPWVPPIDDPVMLVVKGFEELATAP